MSDLRLEDLRAFKFPDLAVVSNSYFREFSALSRPVTRVEVLEALGAEREWRCRRPASGKCYMAQYPGLPPLHLRELHQPCGWVWVVTDAT